jgi:hypothetical protein
LICLFGFGRVGNQTPAPSSFPSASGAAARKKFFSGDSFLQKPAF